MTSRQLYEAILIELNKENAPNITLEDFNYFANKSINNYVNKRYNIYDVSLQTTDDLRVLKATAIIDSDKLNHVDSYNVFTTANRINKTAQNATYEFDLPNDYLHMLNCICIYTLNKTYKCYNKGDYFRAAATRLTADAYSQVIDNFWNRPTYKRPYYYIHNLNLNVTNPTNPYDKTSGKGTDATPSNNDYLKTFKHSNLVPDLSSGYNIMLLGSVDKFKTGRTTIRSNETSYSLIYYKPGVEITDSLINSNKIILPFPSDTDVILSSENIQTFINQDSNTQLALVFTGNAESLSDIEISVNVESYQETDYYNNKIVSVTGLPHSIKLKGNIEASNIERSGEVRYGNVSNVRCEIRYGQ